MRLSLLGTLVLWMPLACLAQAERPATANYEVGPEAEWVLPPPPGAGARAKEASASGGAEYILVDRQVRLERAALEYEHYVVRTRSSAGVSSESQISVEFDPKLERLRVHHVIVHRGTESIDQLKRGRIEVLQRESELEQGLLDGRLTFHLVMADVRVGDTIDYSYTLERSEPEWGERFFSRFRTDWAEPVHVSRLRVSARTEQPLKLANQSGVEPVTHTAEGWRTLEWIWHDLPGQLAEKGTPAWFNQYRHIEFSQFADWNEVVQAALPLYATPEPGPELAATIARFRAEGHSDPERLVAILRFVQDEIRYEGVELGEGAYRPTDATTVLQRRWGDCKDKTMLAVILLRGVGIEAAPALVDTRLHEHVSERLPSPGVFNHAIVRARIGAATYWLDATQSAQGGDLEHLVQANYGAALAVSAGSHGIEPIPYDPASEPASTVSMFADLRRGYDKPVTFTVSTVHRGSAADQIRESLRDTSAQDLGSQYLKFYQGSYPGIRSTGPLQIQDDRPNNELRIDESYEIDDAFEVEKGGAHKTFEVEADSITPLVRRIDTPVRKTPLELAFPKHVVQELRVALPESLPVDDDKQSLAVPAFRFESSVTHTDRQVTVRFEYQALASSVPVEQLPEFLKKRDAVRDNCCFRITVAGDRPADKAEVEAAQKQLAAAAQLVSAQSWEKADAALTQLLESGKLTLLNETKQHAGLLLAGLAALAVDDAARAQALLKRSTAMGEADISDWQLRLSASLAVKDWPDAAVCVTKIAETWPATVSDLEPRSVAMTVLRLPYTDPNRYALLKALFGAHYKNPGVDPSAWWRDLALMELDRGQRAAAIAALAQVTDPMVTVTVLADNRFSPIRGSVQPRLDAMAAAHRQVDADYKAMAETPAKLAPVTRLAADLMGSLRTEEALKVLDSAVSATATPELRKKFKDSAEQYPWVLDARARALFLLGRWDEAVAQMRAASHLQEHGVTNVSQVINLADMLDRLQRPQEAREELRRVEAEATSAYGKMELAEAQLSAALQLGDAAEVARTFDYIRSHQEDAIQAYEDALVMCDRLDEAAQLLIARLDNPEQRVRALVEVQHFDRSHAAAGLPRARELWGRWEKVTGRPEVQAAIARVGVVGSYALLNSGGD